MKDFAVIFDNDGVLVDSEHISLIAYRRAIQEQGVDLREEDDDRYCGLTDADIIREMVKVYDKNLDLALFSSRKNDLYYELAEASALPAFPGAREFILSLRGEDVPYALASSGSRKKIAFNLGRAGLDDLFDLVVSGEDFERGKPDPQIFLKAAERLGVPPARCAVIEDSINGLLAARAAGALAVGITNTFAAEKLAAYSDLLVASMAELTPGRIREALSAHA